MYDMIGEKWDVLSQKQRYDNHDDFWIECDEESSITEQFLANDTVYEYDT